MYAVPDDPAQQQAIVFVQEFEGIADKLVSRIEDPLVHPTQKQHLLAELREVREQIRQLQVRYALPASHGRNTA